MKTDRKEELLTRWMDDGLSDEELRELEPVLTEHPELHEERADYARLREELRTAVSSEIEPPFPDFFNSHLERLVREEGRGVDKTRRSEGAFNRLWIWWMAPAVAAAVVMAFLLGMKSAQPVNQGGMVDAAAGSEVYSPLAEVSTEVILDRESDSTLLVVEGLAPLADTDLVVGEGFLDGEHGYFVKTEKVY
jgi:anti-sigma factor RsiW